jgi:cobalt-zinc-cadmium efflux system membrane fusion protein
MPSCSDFGTILIVESDMSLGGVLSRVLARPGLEVIRATTTAEARLLAEEHRPRLALVDCGSREGQGPKLVEELQARYPGLPMIVLTDNPLTASGASAGARRFIRFFTKPINLPDLREAMETALAASPVSGHIDAPATRTKVALGQRLGSSIVSSIISSSRSAPVRLVALIKERLMRVVPVQFFKTAGLIVFILVVLAGLGMLLGGVPTPWQATAAEKPPTSRPKAAALSVELVLGQPHTLMVPEDARKTLGISTPKGDLIAIAKRPTEKQFLVLPGSTMLDPTRLYRIRARFAPSPSSAECIEIGYVPDNTGPETVLREIRSGDRVKKGHKLAVFHSVDVANKKNDLIDTMYQLHLDKQILAKAEEHADAVPLVFLWNAQRQVAGDQNNVNRALATLRSWGISEKDIEDVQAEAKEVIKRGGKHDAGVDAKWPRVELKAPDDGVIVERNLALHEIIVDNTTNLFQIARVERLMVLANVPEDQLPELQRQLEKLPTDQRRWMVRTVGSAPLPGVIDDISYIIDPNQHTAVVKGHIDNPRELLRAGQFVSAKVELEPPDDVVEVPVDAVSEDGQQAVVFVVTNAAKHHYTMRRVELVARFENKIFVRSKPFDKSVQPTKEEMEQGILPKEPLQRDDKILQTGVGELKAKLLELESQQEKK